MGFRATLNFRKIQVVLNPVYRIFLNFAKSCILSCLSKFHIKKKFHRAVFEIYALKSHCLRKPGRAKRWGSADFNDILVMQSLSHMNTNGRGLRNFKCFLSENDHPPRF